MSSVFKTTKHRWNHFLTIAEKLTWCKRCRFYSVTFPISSSISCFVEKKNEIVLICRESVTFFLAFNIMPLQRSGNSGRFSFLSFEMAICYYSQEKSGIVSVRRPPYFYRCNKLWTRNHHSWGGEVVKQDIFHHRSFVDYVSLQLLFVKGSNTSHRKVSSFYHPYPPLLTRSAVGSFRFFLYSRSSTAWYRD